MAVENLITKHCLGCDQSLPLLSFHKQTSSPDGHRPKCKNCRKQESGSYYADHRENVLLKSKQYRESRKERQAALYKAWREKNKENLKASKAAYFQANKATIRPKRKAYKDANKKKLAEYFRQRAKEKPESCRTAKRNYKARKKQAAGSFTEGQWLDKCIYHGWACYLCKRPLTPDTVTAEHRIPLSRGGLNFIANIAPACAPCNLSKNNKTEAEYRATVSPWF